MISNAEAAPAVAQLVLFPLLFVSGTYMPIHSELLNRVAGWLPVRPFNEALTGPLRAHTGARLAAPRRAGRLGRRRRGRRRPPFPLGPPARVTHWRRSLAGVRRAS